MTILIGILGPAGSGKSAVANYLVEKYGATRYSLAGPLKEIAKRVFEFSDEQLYGTQAQKETEDPRYGFSPRWLLQRLGTEGIRHVFGEDIWIDTMMNRIIRDRPTVAVCDDVRFVNEATRIRLGWYTHERIPGTMDEYRDVSHRGVVWRLESPWRATAADASHASEAEWTKCKYDHILAPTQYGMENLYRLVDDACRGLGLKRIA